MHTKRTLLTLPTVASAAADELRRRIMSGEFAEGVPLKQDALAAELGISRVPLREALMQLEKEGLVKILPRRGAVVSKLSSKDLNELFELRAWIEPNLLKLSIPNLTEQDFVELDLIIADFSTESQATRPAHWEDLNKRLHGILLSRSGMPQALNIVTSLIQQTDRYTRLHLAISPSNIERAKAEHDELVTLCRKSDIRGATTLLKRHILQAGEDLNNFINSVLA
ncbi:GntR family transcriptional regulator [Paraburkholderia sp. EG285A]|uniref:GntR family transcriptional regulator n=1 Tax=Paraburkholderia sp. EG285A TaxID=3237009 RepID=UPI0034D196AE